MAALHGAYTQGIHRAARLVNNPAKSFLDVSELNDGCGRTEMSPIQLFLINFPPTVMGIRLSKTNCYNSGVVDFEFVSIGAERVHRMKSHTKHLTLTVPARMEFVNITEQVEQELRASGIRDGLCLINAMHITASVFINDDEPGLHRDYKKWLEELAPFDPSPERYHHNRTGEDNADAHHKRQIMGREVVVAVTNGELDFGPWEQIFYGEFDGKRAKRILIKVIGE